MSCRSAASRSVRLNRNTWSASIQRVAMQQVDLHLRRATPRGSSVSISRPCAAEKSADVVEEVVELVDRGDGIGLARRLGPARAAGRRLELVVGVGVRLDQVELDLRRHHRVPALAVIEIDHAAEHLARRRLHRAARRGDSRHGSPAPSGRLPRARRRASRSPARTGCPGRRRRFS